jgi:hypothetical protein
MENEYNLPTDRSIELEQPSSRPQHSMAGSSTLMLDKLMAHINFTEQEFARNIQWQKQILMQVKMEGGGRREAREEGRGEGVQLGPD